MPLEIEVKLKVPDHTAVRERLMALNAQWVGKVRETNVFFDRDGGSLRKADSGLRVRLTQFGRRLGGGCVVDVQGAGDWRCPGVAGGV